MNINKYKKDIDSLAKVLGRELNAEEMRKIETICFKAYSDGEDSVGLGLNKDGVFKPKTPALNRLFKDAAKNKTKAEELVVEINKEVIPESHSLVYDLIQEQLSYNQFNPKLISERCDILEFEFGEALEESTPDLINIAKEEGLNVLAGQNLSEAMKHLGTVKFEKFKQKALDAIPTEDSAESFWFADHSAMDELWDYIAEPSEDKPLMPELMRGFPVANLKGDMTLINGIRFGGKTAVMVAAISECLHRGEKVHCQSAEMQRNSLIMKVFSNESGIPMEVLVARKGLSEDNKNKLTLFIDLIGNKLSIDDKGYPHVDDIIYSFKKAHKLFEAERFLTDYAQIIRGTGQKEQERHKNVAYKFKAVAKELNVHVVVLTQLSRKHLERMGEMMFPTDSDVRESDAYVQAADESIHIFLFSIYKQYGYDHTMTEWADADGLLIWRKRRLLGIPTEPVPFKFNEYGKIEIMDKSEDSNSTTQSNDDFWNSIAATQSSKPSNIDDIDF